ncbi:MAG: hypothetical protein ACRDKH_06305 [Solirubrobacterales bacterium]
MRDLLAPDYTRDSLRKHGGLLLGLGVLMIFLRKGEDWSDFVIFALLAAMAVYLYASVFTTDATEGARPWQAVHSVFGLIFVPLALAQFVDMIGDEGDSGNALNVLWIFGLTAALGFYAGAVKGIRVHLLLASIATIVAWSALWQELLGDEGIAGHFGTYRGLLGIVAIILLGVGLYLWRRNDEAHVRDTGVEAAGDQGLWKASELLTGAGIAAVLACSLGISSIVQTLGPLGFFEFTFVETAAHWDVLLLLVSLGLVGLGSTIGTRGPVYVGAIGLLLFLFIVGFDLDEGEEADPTKLGLWPIVLVVLGGLAVLLSTVKDASLGDQPRRFLDQLRGR